jgi:hypothetical protein
VAVTFRPGATARDQARLLAGDISDDQPPYFVEDAVYDAILTEEGVTDPEVALSAPRHPALLLTAARALDLLAAKAERQPVGSAGPQRIQAEPPGAAWRRQAAQLRSEARSSSGLMVSAGGAATSSSPVTSAFRRPETYGAPASEA